MAKFKIGDRVYLVNDIDVVGEIIDADELFYPIPVYCVKVLDTGEVRMCCETSLRKNVLPENALQYGTILTDDEIHVASTKCVFVRIRTIKYDGEVFYHKMINGKVAEFKRLKGA